MESSGEPGRIHVSEAVYARPRDEFQFEERGIIEIKGKGPMKTYFLTGKKQPAEAGSTALAGWLLDFPNRALSRLSLRWINNPLNFPTLSH